MAIFFGGLIAKILKHVGFNLKGEKSDQHYTRIWSNTLDLMRLVINNGVLSHEVLKEKESSSSHSTPHQHERISILEEFTYEIPKTNITEVLLNTIIKRQKKTNRKITILARRFTKSGSQMPHGVFNDDDDDFQYIISQMFLCCLFLCFFLFFILYLNFVFNS